MALHHSLIECLFVVLLYLIVSLMKMSYPHKYAYSALSLQADCLYELQDSNLFSRHILQCHVSCTFIFFCTYSSQRISVQRLSLILCNFLPHLLLNFLVGYTLFGVMCSFPLRPTVLGHAYVQNSYISLFCALIINHISFMEVHRAFFF